MVRAYWFFAFTVILGTVYWVAEQYEWVGRGKARAVRAALGGHFHESNLRPSWSLDLTSGHAGGAGDLRLFMEARNRPPHLAPGQPGVLMALAPEKAWEDVEAHDLAGLAFSATSFAAGAADSPVKRGTVVAMRTVEGSLAKLRFVQKLRNNELDVQWVIYPPPVRLPPNPWTEWTLARAQAVDAYRARDYGAVIRACKSGIAAAVRAGEEGPVHAQALIQCGGFLDLGRYAPGETERWLLDGTEIAGQLGTERIVATLGSLDRELYPRGLRGLALFYKGQRREAEAAKYFRAEEEQRAALKPIPTRRRR